MTKQLIQSYLWSVIQIPMLAIEAKSNTDAAFHLSQGLRSHTNERYRYTNYIYC